MTEKIYIAGPITDRPHDNLPAFRQAETILQSNGYRTIVPHDLFAHIDTTDFEHQDYMDVCIPNMLMCDMLVMLPDWYLSKGSIMEVIEARAHSIPVVLLTRFTSLSGIHSLLMPMKRWFSKNLSWLLTNGNKVKGNHSPIMFKNVDLAEFDITIETKVNFNNLEYLIVRYKGQPLFITGILSKDKVEKVDEAKNEAYKFLTEVKLLTV